LKLTTDRHEASSGLLATAELLVALLVTFTVWLTAVQLRLGPTHYCRGVLGDGRW